MKILLVTDQSVAIDGDKIIGSANFTDILKRLSVIGEMHLCIRDAKKNKKINQVLIDDISEYVDKKKITFIPKSQVWPSLSTLRILKRKISEADLVVGYIPSLNAEVSSMIAHRAGKKYFAMMVGCTWDGLWNQDWKRKVAATYRFFINKKVMREADYALYVTNSFLQHRYPTRAKRSLGLSDVVLEDNSDGILESRISKIRNKSTDSPIKIATTGTLNVIYKGQKYVLEALKDLRDKGSCNYEYYLIGGGDDRRLRKIVSYLGLEDIVKFVGKISHEEVFKLLDEMDIYIQPSLTEGLPRSLVEAMSRGLPCIGTTVGAIPELLESDYIIDKKASNQIVQKLIDLNSREEQIRQAKINFEEAKKYNCIRLDKIRTQFYEAIRGDFTDENSHR